MVNGARGSRKYREDGGIYRREIRGWEFTIALFDSFEGKRVCFAFANSFSPAHELML